MMQYIIAIGIFQAMIVGALLWKNRLRSNADGLLILLVACIASHLAFKFLIYNFVSDIHVRQQMNTFIGFCYGPLLYLYVLKVKNKDFIAASKWYVFMPFVLGAIAYFTVAGVLFVSDFSDYRLLGWYNNTSTIAMLSSELCFIFLSFRISRGMGEEKPREQKMIKRIAYSFLTIAVLSIIFFISMYLFEISSLILFRSIIYAILTGVCIMIGYDRLFVDSSRGQSEKSVPDLTSDKMILRKAPLSDEKQKEIWDALELHLQKHKTFTDCELNLDKLAIATGINKYHISETLNCYAQRSFYQYINEYRIKYAIDKMQSLHLEDSPVNILSLAYAAGFRAKSSFNRYFKEITGFTPTEHLRSLQ